MLNAIFIALIVIGIGTAAFTGNMAGVSEALTKDAGKAAMLAIGLIGVMALWLGMMRVLRDAGVMASITRWIAPVLRRLFPDIPPEHPAMGAMVLNMASNMMGLGNAATPFGLKAMQELQKLNPKKAVATDSMALFMAINTSGIAVLPTGVIGLRASMESANAGAILLPSILATFCSTVTGVFVAKWLARSRRFDLSRYPDIEDEGSPEKPIVGAPEVDAETALPEPPTSYSKPRVVVSALFGLVIVFAMALEISGTTGRPGGVEALRSIAGTWMLPMLAATILLYGFSSGIKVYESVIAGAREGFQIAVMVIPFLVALLVAISVFRASGALDWTIQLISPITSLVGFPAEALPMAIMRPLSAQGALGVLTETMSIHGPDSFVGYLVSTMSGSTETTFYILAVYFGSIRIRVTRYTVAACLSADIAGAFAALFWCRIFFG